MSTKRWEDELARLVNPVPTIEKRYEAKIVALEVERESLRQQLATLREKWTRQTEDDRRSLELQRSAMVARLSETNAKWSKAKDAARDRLEFARKAEANEAETIAGYRSRLDQITREVSPLETDRIKYARLDQVRRIAGRFYGLNPEDVSVEQSNVVALI